MENCALTCLLPAFVGSCDWAKRTVWCNRVIWIPESRGRIKVVLTAAGFNERLAPDNNIWVDTNKSLNDTLMASSLLPQQSLHVHAMQTRGRRSVEQELTVQKAEIKTCSEDCSSWVELQRDTIKRYYDVVFNTISYKSQLFYEVAHLYEYV